MTLIDLSHTIEHGMITYPGLPAPAITTWLSREASREHYAGEAEFHIGRIDMVANTGTYLDSPSHRLADGHDIAALALEKIANVPAIVVDHGEAFPDVNGCAVLIRTNWSRRMRDRLAPSARSLTRSLEADGLSQSIWPRTARPV